MMTTACLQCSNACTACCFSVRDDLIVLFLRKLFFSDVTVPRWRSELRCDVTSLESGANAWPTTNIPFDPTKCCMWGGSNAGKFREHEGLRLNTVSNGRRLGQSLNMSSVWAGAPLERLGKCSSATGEIISLRKASPTARFVATPSTRASLGITSIPGNSFEDCGSPR